MTRAHRPTIQAPAPRHLHLPELRWSKIMLAVIILIILAGIAYSAKAWHSSFTEEASAPTISKEATSFSTQSEPEILATPTTFRVHAEGPWVEIGKARNGEEVLALPIPWKELLQKTTPENEELVLALLAIDAPPTTNVEGVNPVNSEGRVFYLPGEEGKGTLYGYSNFHWSWEDPHGLTYWKREVIIEGGGP